MIDVDNLYRNSPVLVQNVMATVYGMRARRLRHGGNYRRYLSELRKSEWWPLERLESYQSQRLQLLTRFCYERVPYYRDLFDSAGISPIEISDPNRLSLLPMLEKERLRAHPDRFLPADPPERLVPQTTGGTTGKPLRYFVTPSAMQYNYAVYEARFRNWAGVCFGDRMASFNGKPIVPIEKTKPPFWRHNLAFNQLYFSVYHLNEANLPHYVRRLERFEPRVIVGYVSAVHTLARFMRAHGLEGSVRPSAVLVSSETLFNWIRKDIESAFQCKVHDGYGLGEMTAFISECEEGSLHISPEYGIVEAVDVAGNPELVSTGLFNYGMPLIRYRTGDLIEPATDGDCACGRELPRVKAILGRVDDRIVTADGSVVGPAALSLAFQEVPNLRDAQICQEAVDEILVSISVTEEFGLDDQEFLLSKLRERLGHKLRMRIVRVDEIPRTRGGKHRLVVSTVEGRPESNGAVS